MSVVSIVIPTVDGREDTLAICRAAYAATRPRGASGTSCHARGCRSRHDQLG
jgi:hypothetical protein